MEKSERNHTSIKNKTIGRAPPPPVSCKGANICPFAMLLYSCNKCEAKHCFVIGVNAAQAQESSRKTPSVCIDDNRCDKREKLE